jgi:putative membrane protein
MSSTSNIHRRFRLLFTLPSAPTVIVLLLIVSSPLILATLLLQKTLPSIIIPSYLLFESTVFLTIIIDYLILTQNPIASFRRLCFISMISISLWLTVLLSGTVISSSRLLSFLVIGAFFSAMIRLLIFESVFLKNSYTALLLAVIQPLLLTISMTTTSDIFPYLSSQPMILISGFLLLTFVSLYLWFVNHSGLGILPASPITMFQAFLQAWTAEEPRALESILEKSSLKTTVTTSAITFYSNSGKPMIAIPEIHPGPFYPIGSSNLPYQMYRHFRDKGFLPLVLHGVSGHELNLASKKDVANLLSSYKDMKNVGGGTTCSRPLTVTSNRATANALTFGDHPVIFLTLSPNGMEDFPREIKEPLELAASARGFQHPLIIDAHNSQGDLVDQEESAEAVDAAKEALKKLSKAKQYPFKTGFAHSSELSIDLNRDIGPAGLGLLILEINGEQHALLAFDANNARRDIREKIINRLEKSGISVLEMCTSDTHITAGKVLTTHGYIALGDKTDIDTLFDAVHRLYLLAVERLSISRFDVNVVKTNVRIIGKELLSSISKALDRVIRTALWGGIFVMAASLLLFLSLLVL